MAVEPIRTRGKISCLASSMFYDQYELVKAREIADKDGPISKVLDEMHPDGYWENDGPGYLPQYRSSAWSIILLSQLGAKANLDSRITSVCSRYLIEAMSPWANNLGSKDQSPIQLTFGNGDELYPIMSPGGDQILYTFTKEGTKDLATVNLDGSNPSSVLDSSADE